MGNMRFKVGDRVKIKSLDWYNENKDEYGYIDCGSRSFFIKMSDCCGKIATIKEICKTNCYHLEEYDFEWTDEMIEGLVEEETKFGTASNPVEIKSNANCLTRERFDELATKIDKELPSGNQNVWELPDGYQFVDENGNVINATKIVLEKKKKEYPKTYEECEKVLRYDSHRLDDMGVTVRGYKWELIRAFQILLICRDAYWKIAGEEMGLGKPWEPDWTHINRKFYCIYNSKNNIVKNIIYAENKILAFPTEKMRDAFYENFKEEIEICKELL